MFIRCPKGAPEAGDAESCPVDRNVEADGKTPDFAQAGRYPQIITAFSTPMSWKVWE
jgi:hypothetical protein